MTNTTNTPAITLASFNLTKGATFDFSKTHASLKNLRVVLSWKTPENVRIPIDADLSAIGLKNGKLFNQGWFVYFNQPVSTDEAISKTPDERSGGSESIDVDISKLYPDVDEVLFFLTIFQGKELKQTFGQTTDGKLTVINAETDEEILHINLGDEVKDAISVNIGSLLRIVDHFEFKANVVGGTQDIGEFITPFLG
jgi:tellurium resistance protein TerD